MEKVWTLGFEKTLHSWLGIWVEIEKHENFNLYRFGVEYGMELPQDWELGINLEYDHKIDAYASWMFGLGFGKILYKK